MENSCTKSCPKHSSCTVGFCEALHSDSCLETSKSLLLWVKDLPKSLEHICSMMPSALCSISHWVQIFDTVRWRGSVSESPSVEWDIFNYASACLRGRGSSTLHLGPISMGRPAPTLDGCSQPQFICLILNWHWLVIMKYPEEAEGFGSLVYPNRMPVIPTGTASKLLDETGF